MSPVHKKRKTLDTRVAKIERSLVTQKPEEKHTLIDIDEIVVSAGLNVKELFGIGQGNGANQRTGNEIRITRVEVELFSGDPGLDVLLVRPMDSSDSFDTTDFSGSVHIHRPVNIDKFKVYKQQTFEYNVANVKWVQRFGTGMRMRYNGTAATPETPQCSLVFSNYTGSSAGCQGWVRVFYIDG